MKFNTIEIWDFSFFYLFRIANQIIKTYGRSLHAVICVCGAHHSCYLFGGKIVDPRQQKRSKTPANAGVLSFLTFLEIVNLRNAKTIFRLHSSFQKIQ